MRIFIFAGRFNWGDGRGSNPRQLESQSRALPAELPPPLSLIQQLITLF